MNLNKGAFTLVELIVVVTILGILSTIGFVSYSSYLTIVRDANRISNMKALSDGLELFRTKHTLPLPDNYVEVKASGETIAYQGYVGPNIIETIEFSGEGIDPKDGTYYSYYLTKDKKFYQLMGFLEEKVDLQTAGIFKEVKAIDYSIKYSTVYGKKLGILTDEFNVPVQEVNSIKLAGSIDILTTNDKYLAHFSDLSVLSGTGIVFNGIKNTLNSGGTAGSCKVISDKGNTNKLTDGQYLISPGGNEIIQVYCDMTTDGGGWTMIANVIGEGTSVLNHNNIVNWNPINSDNCSLNDECLSNVGLLNDRWDELMIYTRGYKIKGTKCNDKNLTIKGYSELSSPTISTHRPNNWDIDGQSAQGKCDDLYELTRGLNISDFSEHDIMTDGVPDSGNYPIKMGLKFVGNSTDETALLSYGVTCTPEGLGTSKNGTNYKINDGYSGDGIWQINEWDGASELQQTWFIR